MEKKVRFYKYDKYVLDLLVNDERVALFRIGQREDALRKLNKELYSNNGLPEVKSVKLSRLLMQVLDGKNGHSTTFVVDTDEEYTFTRGEGVKFTAIYDVTVDNGQEFGYDVISTNIERVKLWED